MSLIWIFLLFFQIVYSAEAVDPNEPSFVSVDSGHPQLNISVIQTPVSASVPSGQRVNLQCSVYPENQSAELRVFWFRSAAGSSSPEIIHTHNFSRSSRQCVYNFSKIITDESDTGTFYCAVATCGRIIVGNGTPVNLKGPADPTVIILGAAVGVCVVVIIAQAIVFYKRRNSEQSSGRSTNSEQPWSAVQNSANQDGESAGVNYASVQFKDRKAKAGRVKREQSEDVVYSDVRRHAAANNRSHR
ncbi:uncharacterized protein LOC125804814 [Astyanax mexicanus]|uniref:uncharacterized protein LOC125804814 n=1 Tax=Astyanax mexicanus TaxID=7994 RepID=UPI0020CAA726|nr:uncharacterized protein LOC125804814 [Astyanax mexicanus]